MNKNTVSPEQLNELILITSERLGIKDPSVIEKDYHVTRAIAALAELKNPFFRLIFCGGTCLAKAHRIVNRMSEDIDFKLQLINMEQPLSRSQQKKEIKKFREEILLAVKSLEFELGETSVRNEGQYISIELNYPSLFPKSSTLRPHLLLEFTVSNIRLPSMTLKVSTLIQHILGNEINLDTSELSCVSVNETLAEKWVGLTRRIAAIERGYLGKDDYLIRHLHDIAAINLSSPIRDDFYALARDIVRQDSEQFKTQHPEYFNSHAKEINYSLNLLEKNSHWQSSYENFVKVMVFEKLNVPDYRDALVILREITDAIILEKNLN